MSSDRNIANSQDRDRAEAEQDHRSKRFIQALTRPYAKLTTGPSNSASDSGYGDQANARDRRGKGTDPIQKGDTARNAVAHPMDFAQPPSHIPQSHRIYIEEFTKWLSGDVPQRSTLTDYRAPPLSSETLSLLLQDFASRLYAESPSKAERKLSVLLHENRRYVTFQTKHSVSNSNIRIIAGALDPITAINPSMPSERGFEDGNDKNENSPFQKRDGNITDRNRSAHRASLDVSAEISANLNRL